MKSEILTGKIDEVAERLLKLVAKAQSIQSMSGTQLSFDTITLVIVYTPKSK